MSGTINKPEGANEWVRLNVGGTIFHTTKQTLCREEDSFFACLFDSDAVICKDESGAIMIDRSSEHMDAILNYLRSGYVSVSDRSILTALEKEAESFCLKGMAALLQAESQKSRSKEIVAAHNDSRYGVVIAVPSMDTHYDVIKELRSSRHLPKLKVDVEGGFYYTGLRGNHTYAAVRSHFVKVVTALGFQFDHEGPGTCSFVRFVDE